ncbi:response regulator transcription factor [Streptomyces iranensis]|uniref:DNA-binding NarL/FixJ family response regulator n=1 Tax=Streptomyces iranensis TaxID=576784 RepID=A0A060ZZ13_9ACTN|nr:helix-turn-helix transcriptional regulator [Streptomyces iranensis]MBP2068793.1 DNA-binding NarL/FixJ family response regulator [Streptomyces iranensis]CDR13493.1 transcriptional regulatory protein [Streptomyces iranensis]
MALQPSGERLLSVTATALTDRVIATLVSDGLTNSQIATINRAPHTVSYHLRKMFGTLGVRSRSELAGTARQRLWEAP